MFISHICAFFHSVYNVDILARCMWIYNVYIFHENSSAHDRNMFSFSRNHNDCCGGLFEAHSHDCWHQMLHQSSLPSTPHSSQRQLAWGCGNSTAEKRELRILARQGKATHFSTSFLSLPFLLIFSACFFRLVSVLFVFLAPWAWDNKRSKCWFLDTQTLRVYIYLCSPQTTDAPHTICYPASTAKYYF